MNHPTHRGVPYVIRTGRKKQGVLIQISVDGGVTVIVPRGFDRTAVPAILDEKWRWIGKTLLKQARIRDERTRRLAEPLPGQIVLAAVKTMWTVSYELPLFDEVAVLPRTGNRLVVSGDDRNKAACRRALQDWLKAQARHHLPAWLARVAHERGFVFKRVRVGLQRTRWGSCSTTGTISLNAKLMLFPADVVQYVFIHELCHTSHMHHGPAFWDLVRLHDPFYRDKIDMLESAGKRLPGWTDDAA